MPRIRNASGDLLGKVMSESKDRAAFMMINEAKARMSDKPVPAIIKGLLEVIHYYAYREMSRDGGRWTPVRG